MGAAGAEGVWAHIGSLEILVKHLQGRPGWVGGGVGAVRAVGAVSEGGWRRRRVGGQSADGGGAERV